MWMKTTGALRVSLITVSHAWGAATVRPSEPTPPVELGRVHWGRDYQVAIKEARQFHKAIMVIFDEISGCATCKKFGTGELSHPIVIDASREFVTLAIYNNRTGTDEQILQLFNEPAWNNPGVRFIDANGQDIIPRWDGIWTTGGLLKRMVQALEAANRPVPMYLSRVAFEYNPKHPQTATFGMYCYWEGEKILGAIDGVLGTRIGLLDGREVVDVKFDAAVIDYRTLVNTASQRRCANPVVVRDESQDQIAKQVVDDRSIRRSNETVNTNTQQQYHLFHYPQYHYLSFTVLQATKVNAPLALREDPQQYLSPGQIELKDRIEKIMAKNPISVRDLNGAGIDRAELGLSAYAQRIERRVKHLETAEVAADK